MTIRTTCLTLAAVLAATSALTSRTVSAEDLTCDFGMNWAWAQDAGSPDGIVWAQGAATTSKGGHTCVAGSFLGTVNFGPSASTSLNVLRTAAHWKSGFVALYNGLGEVEWVHQMDAADGDDVEATDVAITNEIGSYDCYVVGYHKGDTDFDGVVATSYFQRDGFVARYEAAGLVFVRELIGYGDDEPASIDVRGSGVQAKVYVGGTYDSEAARWMLVSDADPGDPFGTEYIWVNGDGGKEGFTVRYDGTGSPIWADSVGGPGDDRIESVAASAGEVYVGGSFESGLTIDMWYGPFVYEQAYEYAFAADRNPFWLPLRESDGKATDNRIYVVPGATDTWFEHLYVDETAFGGIGGIMATGTFVSNNGTELLHYEIYRYDFTHELTWTQLADAIGGESRGAAGAFATNDDDVVLVTVGGSFKGQVFGHTSAGGWDGFVQRSWANGDSGEGGGASELYWMGGPYDDHIYDVSVAYAGPSAPERYYAVGTFWPDADYGKGNDVCVSTEDFGFLGAIKNVSWQPPGRGFPPTR